MFSRIPVLVRAALSAGLITFGEPIVHAQIGGSQGGATPTVDYTDVSSLIATGSGYDAWTGGEHRHCVEFEVSGAVSEHGLKWERWGTSFAYTWQLFYRPYYNTQNAIYPGWSTIAFRSRDQGALFSGKQRRRD